MGMVNECEEFDRQAKEILQGVYEKAPDLQGVLSIQAGVCEDTQPLTFKAVIQCDEKPGPYRSHILCVRPSTNVPSEDPYGLDNAKAILEKVKEFFTDVSVAGLYEIFLGRVWMSQSVGYEYVQKTLNKFQDQGYAIYMIIPKPSNNGVLIVAHTEGARLSKA